MKERNQKHIYSKLWKTVKSLHARLGLAECKKYILSFLFFKYLSDLWEDTHGEYAYINKDEYIKRAMKTEDFILYKDCTFNYLLEHSHYPDIGEKINRALSNIESLNIEKLGGIFNNVDFNSPRFGKGSEKIKILDKLFQTFSDFDFRPSIVDNKNLALDIFSYLLEQFATVLGKDGMEFQTPKEITKLMGRLLFPKLGSSIYDPACGSGNLLLAVAKETMDEKGNIPEHLSLYGQEVFMDTLSICKMNFCFHGLSDQLNNIANGDTLTNPLHFEDRELKKFDIVVSNPPFSSRWNKENDLQDHWDRYKRGIPKGKADYAFISHMIESVKENGRMAVIVPHGVLFRGSVEGEIRKSLIKENLLEAVIGLPANLFHGTSIRVAVLIFNKAKGKNTDILFIDASKEYEIGKLQNKLVVTNIEKIVEIYNEFKSREFTRARLGDVLVDKFAFRATFSDVEKNGFNLNISRYVDTFEEEPPVDISVVQEEIEALEKELLNIRGRMNEYLRKLASIRTKN